MADKLTGTFVTLEGIDGSGKTSVLRQIVAYLAAHLSADQYVITREPGGNSISEAIRQVILDPRNTGMDARTEALLYAASRRQYLVETVLPALRAGKLVISDRYVDSSLVYQGSGRHLGIDPVRQINAFATDGLMPQLTLYFDIEPAEGLARINSHRAGEKVDRLDQERLQFYQDTRNAYLKLAAQEPERIITLDASQPLATVTEQALTVMRARLKELQ